MGRIWMPGGGGGADLDVITAGAGDVLAGKVIVDKDGNPLTGTIPDNTGTALEVATNGKTLIPKGYFDGTTYVTNTQATMAGGTKTPTTSAQTIACNGKLMTSNIVIPAFSLPAASSIKKGTVVTIYGKSVTGTWEGYTTSPLKFYVDGTWSNMATTGTTVVENSGDLKRVNNTDNIQITNSVTTLIRMSSVAFSWRLNSAVNLTDYKYVKLKVTSGSGYVKYMLGVSTSSTATSYTKSVTLTSAGTLILDVSSLSGNYFIYFKVLGNSNVTTSAAIGGMNLASVDLIQVSNS